MTETIRDGAAADLRDTAANELPKLIREFKDATAREKLTLFDESDNPIYVPAEHQRRLPEYEQRQATHLARFRERVSTHEQAAQRAIEDADRGLMALNVDPLDKLTGAELQTAAARKVFVGEDCEKLELPTLVERIQAIALGSDKVSQALYARYSAARLQLEEIERGAQSPGVQSLRAALAQLDQALTDEETRKQRSKLEARKAAAQQLRQAVRQAKTFVDPGGRADVARRWGIRMG